MLITFAVLAVYATAGRLSPFETIEAQSLNLRFLARGPVAPGSDVALVMIDDASVARLGQWPFSRDRMAEAVRLLQAAGARVVVFDLLFSEPQTQLADDVAGALRRIRDGLPDNAAPAAAELDRLLGIASPDDNFAAAVAAAGNVLIPFSFVFERDEANVLDLPRRLEAAAYAVYRRAPDGTVGELPRPVGLLAPAPRIVDAAAHTAHVTVLLDADGSLRHERPVIGYRGEYFPSLPVEAVRAYRGLPRTALSVTFGEGVRIGDVFVPTDGTMRLPVNSYGPTQSFDTFSFIDLLEGRLRDDAVRDRIVLIGATALGIGDTFPAPFTPTLPGTEHYATVIDNILHDRVLIRDDRATALDMTAILVGGLAGAALAGLGPLAITGPALVVLLAGWGAIATVALSAGHLWLSFVFPTAAIVLNFAWCALARALTEQRRRRLAERERRNLSRYFSPAVVQALADRDDPFTFDRMQNAAIMFVDLVGFTRQTEHMSPAEAVAMLRQFHRRVERAVFANNGTLDKYMGDGAMACFGVPAPGFADAGNAIHCARRLADDMSAWGRERAAEGQPPLQIGIGLHYGHVLMGNLGGEQQFAFTVTGDAVNVASRLEALTRTHEVTVIASDAVVEAARAADPAIEADLAGFFAIPGQAIRGRDEPIDLWAWRDAAEPATA